MFFPPSFHNDWLYTLFDLHRQSLQPWRHVLLQQQAMLQTAGKNNKALRYLGAGLEVAERMVRRYEKPHFGFERVAIGDRIYPVYEEIIDRRTFGSLLHFRVPGAPKRKKILVVPPLSGHYSTLTRGTSEALLPHMDVYTIDWQNARDVPLSKGEFRFDDFVSYCIDYMRRLGPDLSVLAVCQPSVPVMAATALMAAEKDPKSPLALILMGGPIDTRENPTEVNDYAAARTIRWFESYAITRVPAYYEGAGRMVYPGFLQLFGFLNMNLNSHVQAHWDLYRYLIVGDGESAGAHKRFYDEYLSVMDLPAEFYLETVNLVFKEHALPRGTMECLGRQVRLEDVAETSILCIEGEKDDISGLGQTRAALTLCTGLADERKLYHMQKGVGHYGIFNGRRYREKILPVILEFIERQHAAFGSKGKG
jgi:poly(3-hydroxybutyrate) depolymerase